MFVCRLQPLDKGTDRTDEVKVKNSEIINYLTLKSLNLLTKSYSGYLVINYSVIAFLWFNPTYSGESFWMSKINNSTDFWYLCLKDWLLFAFIYNRRQHISHASLKARKWREKLFWGEVLFRLERRIHLNYRQTIIENNVKFMEVLPPPTPKGKNFDVHI